VSRDIAQLIAGKFRARRFGDDGLAVSRQSAWADAQEKKAEPAVMLLKSIPVPVSAFNTTAGTYSDARLVSVLQTNH
jgi:hypothetical protein